MILANDLCQPSVNGMAAISGIILRGKFILISYKQVLLLSFKPRLVNAALTRKQTAERLSSSHLSLSLSLSLFFSLSLSLKYTQLHLCSRTLILFSQCQTSANQDID